MFDESVGRPDGPENDSGEMYNPVLIELVETNV